MRFSLRLNNDLRLRDYVALARVAEETGFAQLWVSNDLFLRSASVILPAVAQATERIEIGTGILNPYTMNPAEIAMFAATMDELSGNRFNLGLAAGAGDFLRWVGIEQEKPLPALGVIEFVEIRGHTFGSQERGVGRIPEAADEIAPNSPAEGRTPPGQSLFERGGCLLVTIEGGQGYPDVLKDGA